MDLKRKALVGSGFIAMMMAGGVIGLSLFGSSAGAQTAAGTTTTTTPAASTPAPGAPPSGAPYGQGPGGQGQFDPSKGGHTANGITETLLTGDALTKATAAAKAAVPGATIIRVETDAEGATYEAHMTKSDGSLVTVKLNADFSVKGIENGM